VIVQRYTFRCDVQGCETEAESITPTPTAMLFDANPPRPVPPPGWHRVDDQVVCRRHGLWIDEDDGLGGIRHVPLTVALTVALPPLA